MTDKQKIKSLKTRLKLSHDREERLRKLICILCIILNGTIPKQSRG